MHDHAAGLPGSRLERESAHRDRDDESIRISIIGLRAARALSR
jgi:hypothetical protein